MLRKPPPAKKILLALELANSSGRQQLVGIIRYINAGHPWTIRILQTPQELTSQAIDNAKAEGIDGIITAIPGLNNALETLSMSRIPSVLLDVDLPPIIRPWKNLRQLRINDRAISITAAEYLTSLGSFRNFAFVPLANGESWDAVREKVFRQEMGKRGLEYHVFRCKSKRPEESRHRLLRWLTALPKPVAIFASTDYRATQVLEACHDVGIDIPEQVAILGVDDDEIMCESTSPRLSSVKPDFETEGFLAAQELDWIMSKRRTSKSGIRLSPTITERESTQPLSPAGVLVKRALTFINLNARQPITVRDVVKYLGVSRRLADLRFREIEHHSILETITEKRLYEVRRLLRQTRYPIKRIASTCGFANPTYLKELFRKRFGMTMRDWRATNGTGNRGPKGRT